MQLLTHAESLLIRRNTHMRALFIEYPRLEHTEVNASLFDLNHPDTRFNLPVVTAHAHGIQVRIPALLAGMFELKIQDGKHRFSKRIALQ